MKLWFKHGAWCSARARQVVKSLQPEDVRNIAVIRHAAVGDMVITRPFLVELRRLFPNAHITLSITTNYRRAAPVDLVDHVHVQYGNDRRDVSLREQIKRVRELGEQDLLFDLAATSRSFWLCLLIGAKLKIGFPYHALQKYIYYDITVPRSDFRVEAENMLDMLNAFGHRHQYPLDFAMCPPSAERARPYVLYFPSASSPDKCWPHEDFAQLVGHMSECYPAHDHIVLKGVEEWERIDTIMEVVGSRANVTGISLLECEGELSDIKGLSLINEAALLVVNDTGIRNVAIACNTPTVGIFFTTEVFRYWPRGTIHEAVFNADGSIPDAGSVFAAAQGLMEKP
jgi:ADP-heptose:LPS heptosyltransferase